LKIAFSGVGQEDGLGVIVFISCAPPKRARNRRRSTPDRDKSAKAAQDSETRKNQETGGTYISDILDRQPVNSVVGQYPVTVKAAQCWGAA
jgi:hypothetical protein